ncbi:hypothetical protein N0V90_005892 [Kalmusia sp. IMI 367209]|nr:hypothetical protein N0V90_005892 [Kalmusia sp. IMI 367209]
MSFPKFEGALQGVIPRTINAALAEPILTGSLLYLLTRSPLHIRERLLRPFSNWAKNGASRLASIVNILKLLLVLGVARRTNQALNRFALNGWAFRRQGAPFEFGPAKKELVVITGGSSGFGYEMVKTFSKHARVVAFDVNPLPAELETLSDVHFYQLDISDFEKVQEVCADVRREHGDPSVLVNNAGVANGKPVLDTSNEATERIFKINIIAHFTLIREFLPGMLRMRKGHIVTVASMLSFFSGDSLVDYACTKIGALYLNDGIRAECLSRYPGGEGICTTSVHPGWYDTGIIRGARDVLAKRGIVPRSPVEVSDRVVEQVLKARSGRLVVPAHVEMFTGIRSLPLWFQDVASGVARRKKEGGSQIEKVVGGARAE